MTLSERTLVELAKVENQPFTALDIAESELPIDVGNKFVHWVNYQDNAADQSDGLTGCEIRVSDEIYTQPSMLQRLIEGELADQNARQLSVTRKTFRADSGEEGTILFFTNRRLKQREVGDDAVAAVDPDMGRRLTEMLVRASPTV